MPEGDSILYYTCFLNKEMKNLSLHSITNIQDCKGLIHSIDCKGKLLYLKVDHFYIHIHFGLKGYLDYRKKNEKYEIVFIKNNLQHSIYLNDDMKLSSINKYSEDEHEEKLNKLGASIFNKDFTLDYFKSCFINKRSLLCSFLMEQSKFSGIGNFIKNEVIYLSGIDIYIKVNALSDEDIENLYKNILFVAYSSLLTCLNEMNLESYIEKKYEFHKPSILEIPYELKIYNKKKIGDKIVKNAVIAGRNTFYVE